MLKDDTQGLGSMGAVTTRAKSGAADHAGSRTRLAKCGLALGAIAVALAMCEVGARMLFPAPPDGTREPKLLYVIDSELGYFHVANQQGWLDGGLATINSLGFRGAEVRRPKPKGLFRVGVVGDSLTFGWGVNDDETYCAQLERLLREKLSGVEVEVVNCGVNGYATNQERALLERSARPLELDLVLVGFYWNDLTALLDGSNRADAFGEGATQVLGGHKKPGEVVRMNPSPSWWSARLRRSRAIYCGGRALRGLLRRREGGVGYASGELMLLEGTRSPVVSQCWGKARQELERICALSKAEGFRVAVSVLPSRIQAGKEYPNAQYQSVLKQISEELGWLWIDPLPRFLARRDEVERLYIPYDMHHPTAAGHRLIAEAICDALEQHPEVWRRAGATVGAQAGGRE